MGHHDERKEEEKSGHYLRVRLHGLTYDTPPHFQNDAVMSEVEKKKRRNRMEDHEGRNQR